MKSITKYPKYGSSLLAMIPLLLGALVLSGCGQEKTDVVANAGHDHGSELAYVPIPHSHEEAGEICFICDASKRDKGRLWCTEHARYEDRCWLCHPELEDKSRMWCKEHSLYEDECYLCHPELKKADGESASSDPPTQSENASHALFCNEHGVAEAECGICQPDLAASLLPGDEMKVRMISDASASKAGIKTEFPRMSEISPVIETFCETQYNLNTLAKVTPLVGGVTLRVHKDVGDKVVAGEPLVELHSSEVAAAKSDYLSAVVDLDIRKQSFEREVRLQKESVTSEKDLLEAKATYRKAQLAASNLRQRLINLGLDENEIAQVEEDQDTSARLMVRAPFSGTLVERKAVMGEAVKAGYPLFTLADLSTRWLEISVPAEYVGQLQVGQAVEATFPELPNARITGKITWVDTTIDPNTRMLRARATVSENAEQLTSGLFGKIFITTGRKRLSAILPKDSVQRHEGADYVFVQNAPDLFALRRVSLGQARNGEAHVLAGLDSRDSVVTDGSFIVMSEFLKSRLGAGCVDD